MVLLNDKNQEMQFMTNIIWVISYLYGSYRKFDLDDYIEILDSLHNIWNERSGII